MKKLHLIPMLFALTFNTVSCSSSNQAANEAQTHFTLTDKRKGFVKDGFGTPYVEFKYNGDITNQTSNIYKKATVRMVLEFALENGQVLTDVDIAEGKRSFGAAQAFDLIEMYSPNQVYNIKDLKSNVISNDYARYPIKSVTLKFTIELIDEINNNTEEFDIKSEDITDEWKKVVDGNVPTED